MKIIELESIESTNAYAKNSIELFEDKTVIVAKSQTSGRGRLNRKWVDFGEGNVFMTIILKPSEDFKSIYANLTQYLSVSLCKVLEKYSIIPKIKWPNDVLIDGKRKISGILSETVIESGKLKGIVLGLGVNLKSTEEMVNSIPDRAVTALNLEIGKSINQTEFIQEILDEFFKNYDAFLKNGFEYIQDDYISRNCFLHKDLTVQVLNTAKTGYSEKINNNGELVLRTDDNKELILNIGDIL